MVFLIVYGTEQPFHKGIICKTVHLIRFLADAGIHFSQFVFLRFTIAGTAE